MKVLRSAAAVTVVCSGLVSGCSPDENCEAVGAIGQQRSPGQHMLSVRCGALRNDHGFAVALDGPTGVVVGGRIDLSTGTAQVVKYDAAQRELWSLALGSATGSVSVTAVGVDGSRNTYVTGNFQGTVDFLGLNRTAVGKGDVFVLKLDRWGSRVWVRVFGSAGHETANAIAVRSTGETVITGTSEASIDFGGGALPIAGEVDAFVLKLTSAGNYLYSRMFGSTGTDHGLSVAMASSGEVYVAGLFEGNVDFGAGAKATRGSVDGFLTKLSSSGATVWSNTFGGAAADKPFAVSVNGTGGPTVVGEFKRTVDFGGGMVTALHGTDAFVVSYTEAGAYRWSHTYGGATHDRINAVAVDTNGVSVAGDFQGTDVSFGAVGTASSNGARDIFVIRYDNNGGPLWLRTYGAEREDIPWAAATHAGQLTVVGTFRNTVDFGGGELTSAGELDQFLLRLAL